MSSQVVGERGEGERRLGGRCQVSEDRKRQVERFTDLEVWRKSHHLFLALLNDLDPLPPRRSVTILSDQILRSVGSVGANIAEGFNRSKKKYLNSLDIALGEADETENWLYKLRDASLLDRDSANHRIHECIEIQKMPNGLIRSIRKTDT
jgi:four helix bundle protein